LRRTKRRWTTKKKQVGDEADRQAPATTWSVADSSLRSSKGQVKGREQAMETELETLRPKRFDWKDEKKDEKRRSEHSNFQRKPLTQELCCSSLEDSIKQKSFAAGV
jgi:hypothetical protein